MPAGSPLMCHQASSSAVSRQQPALLFPVPLVPVLLQAAARLVQNREAVTKFALRGVGQRGSRPVSARLCDPTAIPGMEHLPSADAGELQGGCAEQGLAFGCGGTSRGAGTATCCIGFWLRPTSKPAAGLDMTQQRTAPLPWASTCCSFAARCACVAGRRRGQAGV